MSVGFSVWNKEFSINELSALAEPGDIASLIKNIYLEEARANGKQHVFVKENHVYEFLPFLMIHFPESKYVYQSRDPRDMALSWKLNLDHPGGVVTAAHQWKKDQQSSLKVITELQKIGKAISTTYEELIDKPLEETRRIINFLGLPHEKEIIDFHKDTLTRKNAKMQAAWGNLEKAVISDNKNKYKNDLSEIEVMVIEKICWYEMNHLGYKPEYDKSELNRITMEEIDELDKFDKENILLERSDGVMANMEAKKRFYQKISW